MTTLLRSPFARLTIVLLTLSLSLLGLRSADATTTARTAATTASTKAGTLTTRIVGETGNGRRVTGTFVPLRFVKRDGKLLVRGLVRGVVHENDGTRTTFATMKTARVASINGMSTRASRTTSARATCDILHLVLGPLDLDLLGLQVHLDRVVLNVDAAPGAGNLLGNLLCAVAGLLDGTGLGGILGRITNLLNQILGQLRLG